MNAGSAAVAAPHTTEGKAPVQRGASDRVTSRLKLPENARVVLEPAEDESVDPQYMLERKAGESWVKTGLHLQIGTADAVYFAVGREVGTIAAGDYGVVPLGDFASMSAALKRFQTEIDKLLKAEPLPAGAP